jgi:hypothetical protein
MRGIAILSSIWVPLASGALLCATIALFCYEASREKIAPPVAFYTGTAQKSNAFSTHTGDLAAKLPPLPDKYRRKVIVLVQGRKYPLRPAKGKHLPPSAASAVAED